MAKLDFENAISDDLETSKFQNFPLGANHGGASCNSHFQIVNT